LPLVLPSPHAKRYDARVRPFAGRDPEASRVAERPLVTVRGVATSVAVGGDDGGGGGGAATLTCWVAASVWPAASKTRTEAWKVPALGYLQVVVAPLCFGCGPAPVPQSKT
jgi:hypothetical protein